MKTLSKSLKSKYLCEKIIAAWKKVHGMKMYYRYERYTQRYENNVYVSWPKETRKRKNLQLALHAHACRLRCTLSAIRSGMRYAKWAGGSRSQTHRRAAMGGFTQDDGYVRGVAPPHGCSSGSFSNFCNFSRLRPVLELSPWYRYRSRSNTACHGF
jgi:hypothetical protein